MRILDWLRKIKKGNNEHQRIIGRIKDVVYLDTTGIQLCIEKGVLEWNMVKGIKGIEDFKDISCDMLDEISVKIDNVSQFDLYKLDKLESAINIKDVTVFEKENVGPADYERVMPYSIKQYREILDKIEKIKNDIQIPPPEDKDREYKLLSQIYITLGNLIQYNKEACKKQNENDKEMQTNARNLYGGLVNGKAVCGGYAEILRNMCSVYGITCNSVISSAKGKDCHAYNQVCIGGKWYNCDLTFDQADIVKGTSVAELKNFLKSDHDFKKDLKDKTYHTTLDENAHICEESYIFQTKESNNIHITKECVYSVAKKQKQSDINNVKNDMVFGKEQETNKIKEEEQLEK